MSANDHNTAHEEEHTGPVKTPKQLLLMVFYSLVIPIFAIIALVYFVTPATSLLPVQSTPKKRWRNASRKSVALKFVTPTAR